VRLCATTFQEQEQEQVQKSTSNLILETKKLNHISHISFFARKDAKSQR
jgi:hypothetical protein